jgi:hypothetical protein
MRAPSIRVALPNGAWMSGGRLREVNVRPLTGSDEAMLADTAAGLMPAERTSALLARCIDTEVGTAGGTLDLVRRLTVGDREALLLHLHRLTFGDALHCVLDCPDNSCRERMDVDLSVSSLLSPTYDDSREWYDLPRDPGMTPLRFRIPTGADQEWASRLAQTDAGEAAIALVNRCLAESDETPPTPASLDEVTAHRLAIAMLEHDPQAEIMLDVTCPACGHTCQTLFDAGGFLYRELEARLPQLYREVHAVALHYHWSEAEILGLTQPQRQRYLDLLAETVATESA